MTRASVAAALKENLQITILLSTLVGSLIGLTGGRFVSASDYATETRVALAQLKEKEVDPLKREVSDLKTLVRILAVQVCSDTTGRVPLTRYDALRQPCGELGVMR